MSKLDINVSENILSDVGYPWHQEIARRAHPCLLIFVISKKIKDYKCVILLLSNYDVKIKFDKC